MKTLMIKSLIAILALAFCVSTTALGQQPGNPEREQPQENPTPAELLRQLLPQNGDTNGLSEEALADLVRAAAEARQANGENQTDPGSMKPKIPAFHDRFAARVRGARPAAAPMRKCSRH